jgi:O-antigen biosynthesis protein
LSYLEILARAGFNVTFALINLLDDGRYTQALGDLGIKTLSAPEWASINGVIQTVGPQSDILLFYRAPVASRLLHRARRVAPAAKILFHPVDLHFLRMEREAELTGDQSQSAMARAMRDTELGIIARADATIVVSSYEMRLLRRLLPRAVLHQIPILREAPLQFGAPGRRLDHRDPGLGMRRDFLFIGGYEHTPNVDAVMWFVREVWPIIQSKGYSNKFIIAGSKLPKVIAALASDKIDVLGFVDDIGPLFAACRMSIAPLRYGGGIKGKIVTSLSYGVPVVATSIAAEGMGLRHEENILVADDPEQMADQIMRLYVDDGLWQRLSSNGYQAFQDNFSLTAGAHKVLAVFDGLLASAGRGA